MIILSVYSENEVNLQQVAADTHEIATMLSVNVKLSHNCKIKPVGGTEEEIFEKTATLIVSPGDDPVVVGALLHTVVTGSGNFEIVA